MKVPQWGSFKRLMDAATQIWGCDEKSPDLKLKTQFWG